MNQFTECVTILKEEYDDLQKAANALMIILNTDPVYMDKTVAAVKRAVYGIGLNAEPVNRAEISE